MCVIYIVFKYKYLLNFYKNFIYSKAGRRIFERKESALLIYKKLRRFPSFTRLFFFYFVLKYSISYKIYLQIYFKREWNCSQLFFQLKDG